MLALARIGWRNLWRQRRRTLITTTAMAVGVAFCMAVITLIDGVYADLFDMVVTEDLGHAQVHHPEYPGKRAMWETVGDAEQVVASLEALPEVVGASGRLFGHALLATGDESVGARLVGVDPAREDALTGLEGKVRAGRYLDGAADRGILLGVTLADRLEVEVGGEVVALTQAADGSVGNELYTVVGLFESGSVLLDRSGAYLHLADLQDLLVLPGQVHEISLVAPDREGIEPLLAAAAPVVGDGLLLRSWAEVHPQMAQMMEMADASSGIMLFFIFGVAALGILNTLLMSVFERTRELGICRALGLRPLHLVRMVLWETLGLVAVSLAIGIPLGLALDAWLVLYGLDLSGVVGSYSVLGVDYDPVMMGAFDPSQIVDVVVGLLVVSFLAAIWPAVRAARLKPVDAMRLE